MMTGNEEVASALFDRRSDAERAVEHLVQEHGIERAHILLAPVGEENSAGTIANGSDAARADAADCERSDAPSNGCIELTVGLAAEKRGGVERSLAECGGRSAAG
ncbi:hypothetical protein [Sphingopyxis terrae]